MDTEQTLKSKKLHRSQTNKMLFGVCGGIAEYFDINSVFIRILFLILLLTNGWMFLAYFALLFIMPVSDEVTESGVSDRSQEKKVFYGILIIISGIVLYTGVNDFFYFDADTFPFHPFMFWTSFKGFILTALLVTGIILIFNKKNKGERTMSNENVKKLYISDKDKKFWGICGGIAEYFEVDSTLIRLGFLAFLVLSGFFPGIIIYILMKLVIPSKPIN